MEKSWNCVFEFLWEPCENKETDANFMGQCPTELAQSGVFGNLMSNGANVQSWQNAVVCVIWAFLEARDGKHCNARHICHFVGTSRCRLS